MAWDSVQTRDIAEAYLRHNQLSQGDRGQRASAEAHWWAWEAVEDGAMNGDLPVDLLDYLLHHPDATDNFRGDVAAGPIEDALFYHPATYGPAIAALCESDPVWADTVAGVWLDDMACAALPDSLRQRIPIHSVQALAAPTKRLKQRPRKRHAKRARHT